MGKDSMDMYTEAHGSYDFTNHVLSFFTDSSMRKRAAEAVTDSDPKAVLDIATGTGDTAIEIARLNPKAVVVAMDANPDMLSTAKEKALKEGVTVKWERGDALKLRYPENRFDAVSVSFALKNMESLDRFAKEAYRVLRKDGKLVIADISIPDGAFNRLMFRLYICYISAIGFFTGKKLYRWLPGSTSSFSRRNLVRLLAKNGFRNYRIREFFFGIAYIITYTK